MKYKDKVWFLYTIYIGNLNSIDVPVYLREVLDGLKVHFSDDSIEYIVVPSRTEDNNVQLLYDPKGYKNKNNRQNLRKAKELLNKLTKEYGL